jgi:DNA-binding NtrC family response regulator
MMVRRIPIPQSFRILAVGRDISLLSSRANLLTQAGYSTDLVHGVDQAVRRERIRRYHLAVVSDSFNSAEQIAIRSQLKQVRHRLPVLLLTSEHDSPDTFLAAVARYLKAKKTFRLVTQADRSRVDSGTPNPT